MTRPLLKPVRNILDLVGNTPMLQLTNIPTAAMADLFVKLEFLSPGFSVKDRIGVGMIERAARDGKLAKGGTIIEPTAGNTGIALALAGTRMGYRVILCVPENFSLEKREVMKALGGEVVLTPKDDGMKGAIAKAEELSRSIPDSYVPQQFTNHYNSDAHYATTGPEIWEQMEGRIDGWLAGAGTGGTFSGVARYLKERNPNCWCVIVEPQGSILKGGEAGPHEVEGIGASSFIPPVLDMSLADDVIQIYDDPAFVMVRRLAAEEGVLGASSAGANVAAALQVAEKLGPGKRIVTLIPDASERYMSKGIYTKWAKAGGRDSGVGGRESE
ncbi:MAG TPA: cysteine synthase A [Thermoanaerobaculia bacterium]|nr:cysteine synthase A [Thermoanaerobaculia bacterium]